MSNWKPIIAMDASTGGKLITVNPTEIVVLRECQARVDGTDNTLVAEYAEDMREYDERFKGSDPAMYGWMEFPRLECIHVPDTGYILTSGHHRLEAILQVGYEDILVYATPGTRQDAIVWSKRQNADNGKRRTNADKAHVVKSCLLDDELKLWSDRTIAKWCGVAPNSVKNQEKALRKMHSGYERPTRRKRLSNTGEIEWVETASIGNGSEKSKAEAVKAREKDCKARLRSILNEHHKLDATVYNVAEFAKEFDLYAVRVETLARDLVAAAIEKARADWQKAYTKVRTAWFNNVELSKSVEWEMFTAAVLEQVDMVFLTEDTFENPDARLKSRDLELLIREKDCLLTLGYHVRNPSFWVSALIPCSPETEPTPVDAEPQPVIKGKEFTEAIEKCIAAEKDLRATLTAMAPDWAEMDFMAAACDRHNYGVVEFPDARETDIPAIWASRYRLLIEEINLPADWVQEMLTEMAEPIEPVEEPVEDTEKANALEKFANQKDDLYKYFTHTPIAEVKDEFGFVNKDKAWHQMMLAAYKVYELSEDLLWNDTLAEELTTEEILKLTGTYFLILQDLTAPRSDWAEVLYQKAKKEVEADAESEAESKSEDTSLADLNLPTLKGFLDTLLDTVGQVEHPTTRDDLSVAVLDVFSEKFEGITEREILSTLIDCAQSIVSESEVYPRGQVDTLDNEVLCLDDEADRQAMNSNL